MENVDDVEYRPWRGVYAPEFPDEVIPMGDANNQIMDDIKEAARWVVRSRDLLLRGGVDGRVVEDTRTSLGIIEKYLNKAIVRMQERERTV